MPTNIVYIYGEGNNPNKNKILENLPKDLNVSVLKFTEEKLDLDPAIPQINVFRDEIFSKNLTDEEVIREERWLGHPFYLALQYNHLWHRGINKQSEKLRKYYEILAKMTIYFRKYFTENKIEFFSMNVASRLPFVISLLTAKKLGLKPLIHGGGGVGNIMFLYSYDFNPLFWKKINPEDVSKAKDFFHKRYTRKGKKQESKVMEGENRRRLGFINSMYDGAARLYKKKFPKRKEYKIEYKPVSIAVKERLVVQIRKAVVPLFLEKPDFSKKFLFFPMHHDEETHLSWREYFINQWELMRRVSECLPLNVLLFVKPHPNWLCSDVPVSELLKLRSRSNIRVLHPSINPLELIKRSIGVITINSTTGLEAITLNRPLITFGHNFYAREGISLPVKNLKELPGAIEKVVYHPGEAYDQDKRDFMMAQYHKNAIVVDQRSTFEREISEEDGKRIADEMVRYIEHLRKS